MNKKINAKLMEIYILLYESTGSRHWWPAETTFEVIVGAILTQFVSWKNVTTAVEQLKREGLLSIEGIYHVDVDKLEELIRCTRFYKQKARKLKVFCSHITMHYGGDLDRFLKKDLYELRDELLTLYGIGEETADCIILYAAGKPIFVVDSYTRRVYSRIGLLKDDITYSNMQKFFMENLEHDAVLFNEYHAQIDGVGSHYCFSKNPECSLCPLKGLCQYAKKP